MQQQIKTKTENPLHHKICVRNIILSENILFHIYLNLCSFELVFEFVLSVYSFALFTLPRCWLAVCCAADDVNSILEAVRPLSTNIPLLSVTVV